MSQSHPHLFSPYTLGSLHLANRIVMSPMTRCRAINHVPTDIMVTYYEQRASAGLSITEGTSPSPDGLGYARIPGIYSPEQVAAWKKITDAVHAKGGKIFVQLMHTGRISHPANMPEGARIISASAIAASTTKMWTDTEQMQPVPTPLALELSELPSVIQDYVHASRSAMEAGFDGVELHGANGYLLEQFLSPASNQRTDDYGGSFENRNRLTIEVASAVAAAIGGDKLGIRLSPYGVYNDITAAPDVDEQYTALAAALKAEGLVYIHIVDHSAGGAPEVPQSLKDAIRAAFGDTIILSGGYDADRAESDLIAGLGNLVAFGTKFISNPDLVSRFASGEELAPFDHTTFYTADEKGYIDYPAFSERETSEVSA